ncbi:hypothetical protein Btru_070593, partial [Bulinus truncatus]
SKGIKRCGRTFEKLGDSRMSCPVDRKQLMVCNMDIKTYYLSDIIYDYDCLARALVMNILKWQRSSYYHRDTPVSVVSWYQSGFNYRPENDPVVNGFRI